MSGSVEEFQERTMLLMTALHKEICDSYQAIAATERHNEQATRYSLINMIAVALQNPCSELPIYTYRYNPAWGKTPQREEQESSGTTFG